MSLVLNTNIDSLVAQNSLTSSGTQLATALQQLSSGLRINTAADDAAGYAIAQGMTSQINGLNQAAQNANDGVSLTQTASGALTEITNDLQTMRDLAVESLNATNSASDRADLNAQFQQLAADINNVAANTQFNGVNLLDGSFQGATFQIGANAGQIITSPRSPAPRPTTIGNYYTTGAATRGRLRATPPTSPTATRSPEPSVTHRRSRTADGAAATTVSRPAPITLTGNAGDRPGERRRAINQAVGSSERHRRHGERRRHRHRPEQPTNSRSAQIGRWHRRRRRGTLDGSTRCHRRRRCGRSRCGLGARRRRPDATRLTRQRDGQHAGQHDVTTVDNSNLVLISIDAALQQLATTGAQLGAYQNRFQAAITGLNTDATNLSSAKSAIEDTDYAAGDLEPVEGADPAAGRHRDGGPGQHDPAEHSDAAAEAAVTDDDAPRVAKHSLDESRAGAARRPPSPFLRKE